MADSRLANARTHFREIGRYLVAESPSATRSLRKASVTWALDCTSVALNAFGRNESHDLGFQALNDGERYIFASLSVLGTDAQSPAFPQFLLEKIAVAWQNPDRTFATTLCLADWWRFLPPRERSRLEDLIALDDLISALDFLGHHHLLVQLPQTTPSLWPALRGVSGAAASGLSDEQKLFTQLEKSDRESMNSVLSRALPRVTGGMGLLLSTLTVSLWAFLRLAACTLSTRRMLKVRRQMTELARNDFHWSRSSEVLACFWFDSHKTVAASQRMVREALTRSLNPMRLIRALDWYFFTSAHMQNMELIAVLYRLLIPLAGRLAPFLLPDIRMHFAILQFYRGRCLEALVNQSRVEADLHAGDHPFNRDINLANALRSAIVLRTPQFANSLYNKVHRQSQLKGGLNLRRTTLCIGMQRVREDGLPFHRERFWSDYETLGDLPPIARGSYEALLAVAFLEARALEDAKVLVNSARRTLARANSAYPFRKMLMAVEKGIETGNKDLSLKPDSRVNRAWDGLGQHYSEILPEISIPASARKLIAVGFNEPFLSQDEQITMFHILNSFFEAEDFPSLCRSAQASLQTWLPEFRYLIIYEDQTIHSEAPLPFAREEVMRHLLNGSDQAFSKRTTHGLEWTMIGKMSSELKLAVVVAAPAIYRRGSGTRFLLAGSLANSFTQAVQQITSRALRLNLEREALAQERDVQLGRLASQVAHDIRSPLSALRMAIQSAKTVDPERRVLILSVCERIDAIANQILRGYRELAPVTSFSVARACEQILNEKRAAYRDRPVEFLFRATLNEDFDVRAHGDEKSFLSILSNLINNSLDAIPGGGRIEVELDADIRSVNVRVRDTGCGIKPFVLESLKNGLSISTKKNGNGIGLKHALEQIAKWNGSMSFQTELGRGTLVQIKLKREIGLLSAKFHDSRALIQDAQR